MCVNCFQKVVNVIKSRKDFPCIIDGGKIYKWKVAVSERVWKLGWKWVQISCLFHADLFEEVRALLFEINNDSST